MTKNQILALKSAVQKIFPESSRLQYHSATDIISGYGRDLTSPRHAVNNIGPYGHARYVLAERGFGKSWVTIHGEMIVDFDGKLVE